MAYEIVFNKAVFAQIERLPGNIKAVARQEIAALSSDPRPSHSKELVGHPNYYRIWLSAKYRLVWLRYVGPKTPDLYATLGLARPANGDDTH